MQAAIVSDREKRLTINQAADQIQVHHATVRRWIQSGKLRAYRYGQSIRIDQADLNKFRTPVTPLAEVVGSGE